MKTVIDKNTGKVLYSFFGEIEIKENEMILDLEATGNFYNFDKKEFYDK